MNTSTETCPSLEDLAAFLDGRLSGDERARVIDHLADCSDCYEVFAEAARFQLSEESEEEEEEEEPDLPARVGVSQESSPAPAPARVVPFPRKPIFRWASSIAAVLAVGLAMVPLYRQYYTMPELTSQKLVSPVVAGRASQDKFWSQWTTRGPGASAGFEITPHEFLLGAHLVDLHHSLVRRDEPATDDALARINGHIAEFGYRTAKPATFYATARDRLSKGQLPKDFLQQAEQMEASLKTEEYPYLAFGKWTEAGRLSALAENPDFFQNSDAQKFPRVFLHQERENLDEDPEVKKALDEIQKMLADSDPSSLPYEDLRQQFESILTHYQEQSRQP